VATIAEAEACIQDGLTDPCVYPPDHPSCRWVGDCFVLDE
jgi:hypothetical protein